MKTLERYLPALFLMLSFSALAELAPWYRWRSVAGYVVCAQTSPGPAWIQLPQPYGDANCRRRLTSAQ